MRDIPPPVDTTAEPLRALVFDSYYDPHRGVIVMFKVMDGSVAKGGHRPVHEHQVRVPRR